MLSNEDRIELRSLRDDTVDEQDKRLLRKAISHIEELEDAMRTVRTLLKMAMDQAKL